MTEQEPDVAEPGDEPNPEQFNGADPPRIYVASLSDYNAGRLHGTWLDAAAEPADIHAGITAMLADSPEPHAEEYAIHDHEGFGPWHLGEYESIDTVSEVARGIEEHGTAFAAWTAHHGGQPGDQAFEEAYLGHWRSIEDYTHHLVEDMGLTITVEPSGWANYVRFDHQALARDLAHDLVSADADDGGVYLFSIWT